MSFGPFNLLVGERLLTKEGAPIELGARALDILVALTATPNAVVSKKDLMAQVWPDVTVEEGSLRFHMISLRKALGDGQDGARYITTLPGRGYCFVAPVSRATGGASGSGSTAPVAAAPFPHANLPNRLGRMVGRDEDVLKLSAQLATSRIVTIVGAGGIGKTTVAVAVGNHLSEAFGGAALFVDFGVLSDPKLAATALASMLGLPVGSDNAIPSLISYLRDKRILLLLDTCEHLVDAVAELAENIIVGAPRVHILATSREALRIEGEHVYRLDALACPPDNPGMTAAAIQTFPAMQLFLERATASGASLEIGNAEARIVASICRKLDGVALAVELAAKRVESCGLSQTEALLDQHLTLKWVGSRTAPARQKTLQATLDWSYQLLSDVERRVLRRLAVFIWQFTLDAALEITTTASLDRSTVVSALDSLVVKSIVSAQPAGAMMRYRLLDATRTYVLEIGIDGTELADLAVRHAAYHRRWLAQAADDWESFSTGAQRGLFLATLHNVRAALEWCFGEGGDRGVGVRLAAAAAPVFLALSLLPECYRWSQRAILALDEASRGGPEEMHLQAGLGASSIFLHGESDTARTALNRGVAIAEEHGDAVNQIGILSWLLACHLRRADFKTALLCARRSRAVAGTIDDPAAISSAHSMLGRALHVTGDLNGARGELEASQQHWSRARRSTIYLAHEFHFASDITLARVLWLQGYAAQAAERAHHAIKRLEDLDNPALLVVALAWGVSVFLWTGDFESAEAYIDTAIYQAESHSIGPFVAVGRARRAELAIRRGDARNGVEALRACLETIQTGSESLTTELNISLIEGLVATGQLEESAELVDRAIRWVETCGHALYMPELSRLKGGILSSLPQQRIDEAETCFTQAIDLSRRQGAHAWELRAATDLASLWAGQGRSKDAHVLLQSVFEQFTEGRDTADMKIAERLLATLS